MRVLNLKAVFVAGVLMGSIGLVYAEQSLEDQANVVNDQVSKIVLSNKKADTDYSFLVKSDNDYVRIFTTVDHLKGKTLDDTITAEIKKNGVYKAQNVNVSGRLCKDIYFKSYQDGAYLIGVGKNCK